MKKNVFISVMFIFILVVSVSCNTTKKVSQSDLLTNNSWELFTLNGNKVAATDYMKGLPNLNFNLEKRVSGTSGCNNLNGSYELDNQGNLTFGPFATTRMLCPGDGESNFLKALEQVNNVKTGKNKLTLLNGAKEIMVLTPKL